MSKSVIIVSDLSGNTGASTRTIIVGASTYEVDLTDAEYAEYEKCVAPYVKIGRRVAGRTSRSSSKRSSSQTQAIKAWGEEHGYSVPSRGRLPQALVDAYQASLS